MGAGNCHQKATKSVFPPNFGHSCPADNVMLARVFGCKTVPGVCPSWSWYQGCARAAAVPRWRIGRRSANGWLPWCAALACSARPARARPDECTISTEGSIRDPGAAPPGAVFFARRVSHAVSGLLSGHAEHSSLFRAALSLEVRCGRQGCAGLRIRCLGWGAHGWVLRRAPVPLPRGLRQRCRRNGVRRDDAQLRARPGRFHEAGRLCDEGHGRSGRELRAGFPDSQLRLSRTPQNRLARRVRVAGVFPAAGRATGAGAAPAGLVGWGGQPRDRRVSDVPAPVSRRRGRM